MSDKNTNIEALKKICSDFMIPRGWDKQGTPKDLSMDIVSEAAELMDLCIFKDEKALEKKLSENKQEFEHEIADIAFALLNFCIRYNIDVTKALTAKMQLNEQKHKI